MRLVVAQAAARDLADIVRYIKMDSPRAAERVRAAILAAARGLTDFPGMGRPGQLDGTRELPVGSTPYVIIYQADMGAVTIVAIFHGARDIAQAFRERGA